MLTILLSATKSAFNRLSSIQIILFEVSEGGEKNFFFLIFSYPPTSDMSAWEKANSRDPKGDYQFRRLKLKCFLINHTLMERGVSVFYSSILQRYWYFWIYYLYIYSQSCIISDHIIPMTIICTSTNKHNVNLPTKGKRIRKSTFSIGFILQLKNCHSFIFSEITCRLVYFLNIC